MSQTGRWKDSNLANLLGEERVEAVDGRMQDVELTPITKQPFGGHHMKTVDVESA